MKTSDFGHLQYMMEIATHAPQTKLENFQNVLLFIFIFFFYISDMINIYINTMLKHNAQPND